MEEVGKKKTTLGRRKIEMKKIEKKSHLCVTFSKRRKGLFKKASEISLTCGARIGIFVRSPAGKVFAFGHPSIEAVTEQCLTGSTRSFSSGQNDGRRGEYEAAERRLKREKSMRKGKGLEEWWEEPMEGKELYELERYLEALEVLKGNVVKRLEEVKFINNAAANYNVGSSSSRYYQMLAECCINGGDQDFDRRMLAIQSMDCQDFDVGTESIPVEQVLNVADSQSAYQQLGAGSSSSTNPATTDDFLIN